MTRRQIPTRIIETGRTVRGLAGQGVGWLQSLADRARNLRAQVTGVHERLNSNLANGFPSCVSGELLFQANTQRVITIENFPPSPDALPPNEGGAAFITLAVNPIVLSGQTYRIPITFSPPGILWAHNLCVTIEAGYTTFANNLISGITPLNDYRQVAGLGGGFVAADPTTNVIQYTWQQQVLGNGELSTVLPFLPYLWNIIDEKSGRQYAQDWMPSGSLLNSRMNNVGVPSSFSSSASLKAYDSELFEFNTPWQFERDAQVSFLFRPIMDLYQVAASDEVEPYGDDDLSGGRRTEQATVRVEFHGNRYYTSQDVLKDGAFVTNTREERVR